MNPRDYLGGRFLPIEKPERRTHLQELLERRQIGRFHMIETPLREEGFAFELTSSARCLFWASEDLDGTRKWTHRIVFRHIPPMRIIAASQARHFARDRRVAGEVEADNLQQRIEGDVIVGASPTYEPGPSGGEVMVFEFRGGATLRVEATGPGSIGRARGIRATFDYALIEKPTTTYSGPLIVGP